MSYPRTYRFSEEVDTQLLDGDAMIRRGYLAVAASTIIGAAAIYAIGIGPLLPVSGNRILDLLVADTHYKYLVVLLVPTAVYFIIANWVGWQYYQNS